MQVLHARIRDCERIEEDARKRAYNHHMELQNRQETIDKLRKELTRAENEAFSNRQQLVKLNEEVSKWKEAYRRQSQTKLGEESKRDARKVPENSEEKATNATKDEDKRTAGNDGEWQTEIYKLKEEISRRDNIIEQYQKQIQDLRKDSQDEHQESTTKQAQDDIPLREELQSLRASLAETEAEMQTIDTERLTLKEVLQGVRSETERLQRERDQFLHSISDLEKKFSRILEEYNEQLGMDSTEAEGHTKKKDEGKTTVKAEFNVHVKHLTTVCSELKEHSHKLFSAHNENTNELERLKKENSRLSQRLEQFEESLERRKDLYLSTLESEREYSTYASEEAESLRQEVSRQKKTIPDYIKQVEELKNETDDLRGKLRHVEKELQTKEDEKQKLLEDHQEEKHKEQRSQAEESKDTYHSENLETRVLELSEALGQEKKSNETLRDQVENLHISVKDLGETIKALQEEKLQLEQETGAELEELKNNYEELRTENSRLNAELSRNKSMLQKTTSALEEKTEAVTNLQEILEYHNIEFTIPEGGGDSSELLKRRDRPETSPTKEAGARHGTPVRREKRRSDDRSYSLPDITVMPSVVDVNGLIEFSKRELKVPAKPTPLSERYKKAVSSFVYQFFPCSSNRTLSARLADDAKERAPESERTCNSAPGEARFQDFDVLNQPCLNIALGRTDTGKTWYKIDAVGRRRFSDTDMLNKHRFGELEGYFKEKEKEEKERFERGEDRSSLLHKHQLYPSSDNGGTMDDESLIAAKQYGCTEGSTAELRSIIENLRSRTNSLELENSELFRKSSSFERRTSRLEQELKQSRAQTADLTSENTELNAQLKEVSENYEELKHNYSKLLDAYELLQDDCDHYTEEAQRMRGKFDEAEEKIDELRATTVPKTMYRRLEKSLLATRSTNESLELQKSQKESEVELIKGRVKELKESYRNLQGELKRTHSRLRAAYDHEAKFWKFGAPQFWNSRSSSTASVAKSQSSFKSSPSIQVSSGYQFRRKLALISRQLRQQVDTLENIIPGSNPDEPKTKHFTARDILDCATRLRIHVLNQLEALSGKSSSNTLFTTSE